MPFGYTHTLKKISKFPLRYQLPPLWIFKRLCLIGSKGNPKFLWFAFFFFKCFWPPHGIWGSQAMDQIWAKIANHTTAVAMPDPLTHCAGRASKPAFWHCRDATDPTTLWYVFYHWQLQWITCIANITITLKRTMLTRHACVLQDFLLSGVFCIS